MNPTVTLDRVDLRAFYDFAMQRDPKTVNEMEPGAVERVRAVLWPAAQSATPAPAAADARVERTCSACRFRKPDTRPEYSECGHCRRFPPQLVVEKNQSGETYVSTYWPWMHGEDSCGEWQALDAALPPTPLPTTEDTNELVARIEAKHGPISINHHTEGWAVNERGTLAFLCDAQPDILSALRAAGKKED